MGNRNAFGMNKYRLDAQGMRGQAAGAAPATKAPVPESIVEVQKRLAPTYESIRGAGGGLKEQFQLKDPGAVRSPWLDQMLQQQDMMQTQALNRGAQQASTAAASARANLARRGGLSSGAAERLAGAAEEQRVLGAQDIYGQGAAQRLGMQTEDMAKEREFQLGLQGQNLQNTLADIAQQREFDLGKYTEQMKATGAERAAQATEKACFVAGTKIKMSEGSLKNIEDILPGDNIKLGGIVRTALKILLPKHEVIYNFMGTYVSGSHIVFDANGPKQVANSYLAKPTTHRPKFVYNLITDSGRIVTEHAMFADYNDETLEKESMLGPQSITG